MASRERRRKWMHAISNRAFEPSSRYGEGPTTRARGNIREERNSRRRRTGRRGEHGIGNRESFFLISLMIFESGHRQYVEVNTLVSLQTLESGHRRNRLLMKLALLLLPMQRASNLPLCYKLSHLILITDLKMTDRRQGQETCMIC